MVKVVTTEKLPIKLWLDDIENGAMAQARNLANLPFVFKWVSIMPDSHSGYGVPIGGVFATRGVVVPNAVGCFTGDTKIPLLNGTQKTLKELSEEKNEVFVYSLDNNFNIKAGKAYPKLTRKKADIIEVTISGGEVIRCTPDHKFMLLDGSYKEAGGLKKFDSLMPLYRSYESKDGYEHVRTKSGTRVITHKMVAAQFYGDKKKTDIVHHKDNNWYNNEPSNLEYKDALLHGREHRKENPIFGSAEFRKKRTEKLQEKGYYSPELIEKKREVARRNLAAYNKSSKKKEQDKLAGRRGAKYLIKYNTENNHKVLFVKKLDYQEDVYCLSVPEFGNFALSSGVFVHNCDIGCGMGCVRSSLTSIETDILKKIIGKIREYVPVGFEHHKEKQAWAGFDEAPDIEVVKRELTSARCQIGTLGGGNHFLELSRGSDGHIWAMLHSGSRNFGLKIANEYHNKAKVLCERWYSDITDKDLSFLPIEDKIAKEYLDAMNYALKFAQESRRLMMERVKQAISECVGEVTFDEPINIHHNYAAWEHHYGEDVIVHRKGATSAREGQMGLIPGSQGTKSYVVKGKGNPESFMSCSHGAGRKMGRGQAQRTLNLEAEKKLLDDQGIIHAIRNAKDLDEASGAYKDISVVMDNQKDLVDIVIELSPMAVIKG
jgi:tRNA-splicing ligase RtcB